jgi:hypothetical protein
MRKRFCVIISSLFITSVPTLALADIAAVNNTDAYATAYFTSPAKKSPCSSQAPFGQGVIKPHSTTNISRLVIWTYCMSGCSAHIFMTRDCSGPEVTLVDVDKDKGVTHITNYGVNGYTLEGAGLSVTLNQRLKKWYHFFF